MKSHLLALTSMLAAACVSLEEPPSVTEDDGPAALVAGVRLTPSPTGQYSLLSQSAVALGRRRCLQPTSAGAGALYQAQECDGSTAQGFRLQPMSDGSYKVINRANDRCLDVPGWSRQVGAQLGQWDCGVDQANQRFWLQASGWYYTLRNVHSDLCLELADSTGPAGVAIVQRTCSTATSQRFAAVATGSAPGFVEMVSRHSGLCMEAVNAGTTDGVDVKQNTCGTNVSHRMARLAASGPFQTFRWRHSDKCLDVAGASTQAGANLWQWTCNGSAAQRFLVVNVAGAFLVINEGSGRCADIAGWSRDPGGDLHQWDCGAAQANQLFELRGNVFRSTPARVTSLPSERALEGTYPRFAKVNGNLLLGTDGAAVQVRDSYDNGSTWTSPRNVAQDTTPGKDLGNVFPLQLRSGEVLVAVRHHNPPTYRLRVHASASNDAQGPWTMRSELEVGTGAQGDVGVWEPFLLEANDGSLHIYYAKEVAGNGDQVLLLRRSYDAGRTWSEPITVAAATGRRDGMPVVTTLTDGSLLAVFESLLKRNDTIDSVRSYDGGRTWTERTTIYSRAGYYVGAPYITTLGNGELQVVFMESELDANGDPKLNVIRAIGSSKAQATAEGIGWTGATTISTEHALWPSAFSTTCVPCTAQRRVMVGYERAGGVKLLPFDAIY